MKCYGCKAHYRDLCLCECDKCGTDVCELCAGSFNPDADPDYESGGWINLTTATCTTCYDPEE